MVDVSNIVLIRADGSKAIGMGHLNRAALIAHMLRSWFGFSSLLVMREDFAGEAFVQGRGLELKTLPANCSIEDEKTLISAITAEYRSRLWILDVLEHDIDPGYTSAFRSYGARLLAITDDSALRLIDADVVVNGNPNQRQEWYAGQSTRYCVGPRYFMMDAKHDGYEVARPEGEVKRLLVFLGGSDHNDLMFTMLDALSQMRSSVSVLIISTVATGYLKRLRAASAKLPLPVDIHVDVPSLQPFWGQVDCALTAGGNALFERIAVRLPGVSVCQLSRQMEIADRFEELGVNVNLGFGPELSSTKIAERLDVFIADHAMHISQYEKASQILDGKATARVADQIRMLLEGVSYAV